MRDNDKIFSLYKKRMTVAAVTSSVCYGLIIGGGVAFIAALLSWLLSYNGVWIAVGTGLGSAIISGILLFFFKFRPNEHSVARRMDTMGLEERTITMYDLQNTDSPIAEIQRRDACDKIQNVSQSQIKTAFPVFAAGKVAAVCLGVALCAAIGMTLVTGLTEAGVIPGPGIVVAEQDRFVTVSYAVQNDEGGEIEGEFEQIISPGESTEPVAAVAEDGWIFVRWSDGVLTTERQDTNVEEDKEILKLVKNKDTIVVFNKSDILENKDNTHLFISALNKDIEPLKEEIIKRLGLSKKNYDNPSIANTRELGILKNIKEILENVLIDTKNELPIDLINSKLKEAYLKVLSLTGEDNDFDIAKEIFSRFCVGK